MARVPQETIDQIRDRADILDIVSDYVELRRRGRNFFGLCPFHQEKTPSFSVAPDKQIFHCFGCGTGGNAITFLMEYEKISFFEALQKLAQRTGIELVTHQDDNRKEFFSYLYDVHAMANELYRKNLESDSGKPVRQYLEDRGLEPETLKQFAIGLSITSWKQLYTLVKSKNLPDDVIDKCGLFTKTEKGTFDRFRGRLMFPIANLAGRVVAFAGRDLEILSSPSPSPSGPRTTGGPQAKYINSPETPIYHKSELLYGLWVTKDAIRKQRSLIVVEGYMDFLQLYQNGVENVVATSGTALTETHVSQIRKFAHTAFLAYDGDDSGRKAAIAAGYNLLRGGITPEVVSLPDGSDPDSWVKSTGVKPLLEAIEASSDLLEFHLEHTTVDLSRPAHRSRLARDIVDELSGIRDDITRHHTVKQLAELLAVDEVVLMRMLAERSRRVWTVHKEKEGVREDSSPRDRMGMDLSSSTERAQMEIVSLLASGDTEIVGLLKKHVNLNHFSHPVMKSLAQYLLPTVEKEGAVDLSGALDRFQAKSDRDLASKVLFEASPHGDPQRVAVDCLITLEQSPLKRSISEQRIRLRELEKNGEDSSPALQNVVKLQEQLKALDLKKAELLNPS
ncbi:MAG: DNA primase [Fidelibacterota bacterium]